MTLKKACRSTLFFHDFSSLQPPKMTFKVALIFESSHGIGKPGILPEGTPGWRAGGECFAPCNEIMISQNVHLNVKGNLDHPHFKYEVRCLKNICSKSWGTLDIIGKTKTYKRHWKYDYYYNKMISQFF